MHAAGACVEAGKVNGKGGGGGSRLGHDAGGGAGGRQEPGAAHVDLRQPRCHPGPRRRRPRRPRIRQRGRGSGRLRQHAHHRRGLLQSQAGGASPREIGQDRSKEVMTRFFPVTTMERSEHEDQLESNQNSEQGEEVEIQEQREDQELEDSTPGSTQSEAQDSNQIPATDIGDDELEIAWLKKALAKAFEVKDLGCLHYFLGIEVAYGAQDLSRGSNLHREIVIDLKGANLARPGLGGILFQESSSDAGTIWHVQLMEWMGGLYFDIRWLE